MVGVGDLRLVNYQKWVQPTTDEPIEILKYP